MVATPTRQSRTNCRSGGEYEEYHPYGSTAWHAFDASKGVSAKRYRYTGMERDEETGLQYHSARYYAPWLARWTSADPAGLADSLQRYEYSRANPIGREDPTGLGSEAPQHSSEPTIGLDYAGNVYHVYPSGFIGPLPHAADVRTGEPLVPELRFELASEARAASLEPAASELSVARGRPNTALEVWRAENPGVPDFMAGQDVITSHVEANTFFLQTEEYRLGLRKSAPDLPASMSGTGRPVAAIPEESLSRRLRANSLEGVVYLRHNIETGEWYVGQTTGERYLTRQLEHEVKTGGTYTFYDVWRGPIRATGVRNWTNVDVAEESAMRSFGGSANRGGLLTNSRVQILSEAEYRAAGGTVDYRPGELVPRPGTIPLPATPRRGRK